MKGALVFVWVFGFVIANTLASIQFKLAADSSGKAALWRFILGNCIGVFAPVTLTMALKYGNPNLIYALCFGGAFAVLQIVSWRLFQQPLSTIQWAGIACIGLGVLLLKAGA